ncbi:hypothetical protein, partial [Streptomyces sp. UH6]|uniref:hypothetical protein n=1 Tax=Streptomyces sp. UH6 TaxID=2748379 RepID=UPI001C5530AE
GDPAVPGGLVVWVAGGVVGESRLWPGGRVAGAASVPASPVTGGNAGGRGKPVASRALRAVRVSP